MKTKKLWIIASILLVVGLLITSFGCQKPATTPTPAPKPAPAPAPAPTPTPAPAPKPSPTATPAPAPAPAPTTPTPAPAPAPAPKPTFPAVKLKFATFQSTVEFPSTMIKWFMDEVTARTGGAVTFETFYGGALGTPVEHFGLVSKGTADIALTIFAYHPNLFPFNAELGQVAPFCPGDPGIVGNVYRQLFNEFPALQDEVTQQNVRMLFLLTTDDYDLMSTKPVAKYDDFKGLKVGILGKTMPKWIEVTGMVPVTMSSVDRYMAMKTGTLQGSILPVDQFRDLKAYEVSSDLTYLRMGARTYGGFSMNSKSYAGLAPAVQKIIDEVGAEAEKYTTDQQRKNRQDIITFLRIKGVQEHTLPEADYLKFAQAAAAVGLPADFVKRMDGKGLPGTKAFQRYIELIEKTGYKWPAKVL